MLDKLVVADDDLDSGDHVVEIDTVALGFHLQEHEGVAHSMDDVVDNIVKDDGGVFLAPHIRAEDANNTQVRTGVGTRARLGLALVLARLSRGGIRSCGNGFGHLRW